MRNLVGSIIFLYAAAAAAQTVNVVNPSFETGANAPAGWTLSGGKGEWLSEGSDGHRAVSVSGTGEDSNYWQSDALPFDPGAVYLLRFSTHDLGGDTASGGTPITGPGFCNRDLDVIPKPWTAYTSVFMTPARMTPDNSRLRFGQWRRKAPVAFDDVRLMRAEPVYARHGEFTLGDGESVHGNEYQFKTPYQMTQSNHSRSLVSYTCGFNTYRWVFTPKSEVVFRYEVGGRMQKDASVEPVINYYEGGELIVEASVDGKSWREIGRLREKTGKRFVVPPSLLPTKAIWVRLSGGDKASLQITDYTYRATLEGQPADAEGATHFVAVPKSDARLAVHIVTLGDGLPGGNNVLVTRIHNKTNAAIRAKLALTFNPPTTRSRSQVQLGNEIGCKDVSLAPGDQEIRLPYTAPNPGTTAVQFTLGPGIDYQAETAMTVASLYDASFGERLPSSGKRLNVWWASSGWKISQTRPAPDKLGNTIDISGAANETEAAQLVLRPDDPVQSLIVKSNPLAGPAGATIPAENVEVLKVRYVPVAQPTDKIGAAAPWPDPLSPIRDSLDLPAGLNQPLWVRVKIPSGTRAGAFTGDITLMTPEWTVRVPLRVRVYGFSLPDRMTCTSAFGFDTGNVFRYQKLADPAQQRQVIDRYFQDFSAHHICPYNPTPFDDIKVTWPATSPSAPIAPEAFVPKFDWTAWDAAMAHMYQAYHFNSFVVTIPGMGGGTFQSRTEPSLLGYAETTPQYKAGFTNYCRALQEHLREKGWLKDAYVYWFDEPDTRDFPFVMNGNKKLKEAAPDLGRMLTKQIDPALIGGPNIWCPLTPNYKREDCEAHQKAGEKIWWYVCCGPKEPYCGLFIDHPATELRVWLWQTWQRHVNGILIWQTNYWTSSSAYPDPAHPQNPYADSMGWVSGYDTPPGAKQIWGNGDGRFIYPPEAAADANPANPVLDGPVDSIRWEMLRDGVEDYEYFVILSRLLNEKRAKLTKEQAAEYAALLEVPATVTSDLTHFTKDPKPLEERREAVARTIEKLTDL